MTTATPPPPPTPPSPSTSPPPTSPSLPPALPPRIATTRLGRLAIIASLGVGTFTTALSNSVVNAILPLIADEFRADISAVEWVITTFLLVQSGVLLTFGRLGDMIGHRRVYLSGLAVFIGSLVLCGIAPTNGLLIAARVVQAIGAAMFIANSAPILTVVFPPEQRGRVLGIQATTVYVGLATGAPLGGWLADQWGWRSVFLVPIPFAALALCLSLIVLRGDAVRRRGERFDLLGAAVSLVGLVTVLLALNRGRSWGWTSELTIGCALAGAAFLAIFVAIERRVASPMLNLSLFRQRAFSAPVISAMLNYGASVSTTFLLPFALIQGRGLTPGQVGLVLTWQPIVMATTASLSGALSDRIGSRGPATIGMAILAAGLFMLSWLDASTPLPLLSVALGIVGLGVGLFTSPNNSAVLGAVPANQRGVASGVLSTARTLGSVLGIGIAGAVYATTLGLTGGDGPAQITRAAGIGLLVASGMALAGALTSATRPGRPKTP